MKETFKGTFDLNVISSTDHISFFSDSACQVNQDLSNRLNSFVVFHIILMYSIKCHKTFYFCFIPWSDLVHSLPTLLTRYVSCL